MATNLLLYSRDLTQASWSVSNVTVALNQTGLDGVANSASSMTATVAGGEVYQTVTQSATKSVYGVWLKLVSGVGTVKLSQDGGVTWTSFTLTSSWVKYACGPKAPPTPRSSSRSSTAAT